MIFWSLLTIWGGQNWLKWPLFRKSKGTTEFSDEFATKCYIECPHSIASLKNGLSGHFWPSGVIRTGQNGHFWKFQCHHWIQWSIWNKMLYRMCTFDCSLRNFHFMTNLWPPPTHSGTPSRKKCYLSKESS